MTMPPTQSSQIRHEPFRFNFWIIGEPTVTITQQHLEWMEDNLDPHYGGIDKYEQIKAALNEKQDEILLTDEMRRKGAAQIWEEQKNGECGYESAERVFKAMLQIEAFNVKQDDDAMTIAYMKGVEDGKAYAKQDGYTLPEMTCGKPNHYWRALQYNKSDCPICKEIELAKQDDRTLPELPEGWELFNLQGTCFGFSCTVASNKAYFKGEGETPRAAVLAAIANIKEQQHG